MDEQALREALRSEAAEQPFDPGAVGRAVERGRAHRRRRRTALVAAVPVVALAAGGMTAALSGGRLGAETGEAPVARGVGSSLPRPLPLLTQRAQPEAMMLANASGTVTVAENGCLSLFTGSGFMPVAWAAGSTAVTGDDGRIVLYDAGGRRQAAEGDEVQFAGGYQALTSLSGELVGAVECALGETSVFLAQGPVEVLRAAQTAG